MCHRTLVALALYLVMGVVAAAQTQNGSSGAPAPPPPQAASGSVDGNSAALSATAPAPAPAKKVWTNEDVTDLRGVAPVSTVGSTDPTGGKKPKQAANNRSPRAYQAQIARLEGQIPSLDAQIAELQAAIDGKPTGDAKTSQRPRSVKADDWNVEMQELQKKKQDTLDQIAALKDEARHQGVPPNTLP
jgi:hypothetical protein